MATKPPKFKGKYKGPDELKGDPKKLELWRAAKRKAANPTTAPTPNNPAPTTNPAEAPVDGTPAAPTNGVKASEDGGLGLQSNADIESAVLEAAAARQQAESESARIKTEAGLEETNSLANAGLRSNQTRGRVNATSAYRGLRGTTAQNKSTSAEADIQLEKQGINNSRLSKEGYADSLVASAGQNEINANTTAARRRLEFTDSRSRNNPTAGTSPVDAGVSATKPANEMNPLKGDSATSGKSYKGKYKGPDIFKGDKALNAAWRRANKKGRK